MAFNNPSKPSNMPIGMDLVELQDKMKGMKPEWLLATSKSDSPAALPAAMRLSELARLEEAQRAAQAQGASQQPTVVEAAAQKLGLGLGSIAPTAAAPTAAAPTAAAPTAAAPPQSPQPAPQQPAPQQPAPQQPAPQQRPPMTPQLAQALQMAMAQRQGGQGQQGVKSLASGGAIAFSSRGDVPDVAALDEAISYLQTEIQAIGRPVTATTRPSTGNEAARDAIRVSPEEQRRRDEGRMFILQSELSKLQRQKAELGGSPPMQAPAQSNTASLPNPMSAPDLGGIAAPAPAPASGYVDPRMTSLPQGIAGGRATRMPPTSNASTMLSPEAIYGIATKESPEEIAYREALAAEKTRTQTQRQPTLSEAERSAMANRRFSENQATSAPYYAQQEALIGESQKASKDALAKDDPWMRFGLSLLGTKESGFGSAVSKAGLQTLNDNEEIRKLEAAARKEAINARAALGKARMADELGNRKLADKFVEDYVSSQEKAQQYEDARQAKLLGFTGKSAEMASRSRQNTVDELSRMQVAEDSRLRGARRTNQQDAIEAFTNKYIREGYSPDEASDKAYAQYFKLQQNPATQKTLAKIVEEVDERLASDSIHREYRKLKDPVAKAEYRRKVIEDAKKEIGVGGSPSASTSPATSGVKFLGFEK